ncbi:helix-turn-helix domain-containing protein [Paenibacillus sp. JX-17]|uniref:Helix-turn-helix domain-containing protein n=1 Tax=Paenibacillus lacisoli TaxID=3064525 RepID=A0ABT9CF64_9BACL|nr:helix-turn-helix domain-containing protein [Paenibacillus sp. JX-17]MDO7907909.1 helix-turn-helix domain-containing protein [Paenibacillus sp. JX-17]
MQKKVKVLSTLEEIKVYSDPYRIQIMNTFYKLGRPATVKEVADTMGEVPAKVYYHVKKLDKIGLVELVSTREINGIIAKYYQAFEGDIHINHKEVSGPVKQMMLSETQKLINSMFDQYKQKFLQVMTAESEPIANTTSKTIHVTHDEAIQLLRDIRELLKPYEQKRSQEGITEVDFFASMSGAVTGSSPDQTSDFVSKSDS